MNNITLNKEQRIFLLKALKQGCIDLDKLEGVGLSPTSKYNTMTEDELNEEIVRLSVVESDDPKLVERCCKKRHATGEGCYLATYFHKIAPNRDILDSIRAAMQHKS